jgi:hypothetical protein
MHFYHIPKYDPRLKLPGEHAIPYSAFLLCLVYLEAGLPLNAALRSAMADYEHGFS